MDVAGILVAARVCSTGIDHTVSLGFGNDPAPEKFGLKLVGGAHIRGVVVAGKGSPSLGDLWKGGYWGSSSREPCGRESIGEAVPGRSVGGRVMGKE